MNQLHILEKINMMPIAYQQEVEDFIDFILQKKVNKKNEEKQQRKLGLLKGKMKMSEDFNAPLDDFRDYM
ncbi:hypothetical protein ASE74_08350 [Pedobacter sp. Leaf216]|uniref:type II toxin-antitoxin system VapB family antitoxin n=1 Tax=Pedobacter sp. Leaf216 TaxID=1735684 RepID=UPI00070120DB|nr:DUF2281 domain-containing protein [Pedobacter sp. Leaf216]KQM66405.1 hypothetical protein ASE74_08350 [Pedobacter sp. Leaf216]